MLSGFVCPRRSCPASQAARLLVNLSRLCPAQRVRAVCRAIEPGAVRPSMDDPSILPRRQVWLSPQTAWEQISTLANVESGEPLADSSTGLIGNLELHRAAGLLLNDDRAIANSSASEHVIDPQPDEIAALELLSIARLNIARSRRRPFICSRTRIVQTSFGFSGRFWPIRRPLFQGARRRVGIDFSVVIVISDADPFHLSARSASTGCGSLPEGGALITDLPNLAWNPAVRPRLCENSRVQFARRKFFSIWSI